MTMPPPLPPRCRDPMAFPREPSGRLDHWLTRIANGWRPNKRIRKNGWDGRCEFYGVNMTELRVLDFAIKAQNEKGPPAR